ncbi:S-Ena type endospore appendage [Bacillus sp. AR18-7]|uniref:S-Ena type endospore appendage n=1 Tax=Bacillus sp. AR18-7 TaxID=2217821 RepID=UPI0011C925E8|nr:S-Ena type endospore appendage [Bacillus sp. AR18-7]TXR67721.1 DUF3992 domain-containing protein [Bacillus sp. AR18-7]
MSCECSGAALTCCPDKNYVQDKVCSPWSATVVDTITVQPQSSGTFTVRYFTTVRITTTGTTVNQGEFCITVRYPIS